MNVGLPRQFFGKQSVAHPRRQPRRRVLPPGFDYLESRQLLTTIYWNSSTSGDWNTAADWSPQQVPNSSDNVVIDEAGATPTITISSGESESVLSIMASDPLSITEGSLTVAATSTIGDGLSMTNGSLAAKGKGASFTVTGTTTVSGSSLYAEGGATLSLPGLDTYIQPNNCCYTAYLEATGAGSVLSLPGLASIANTGSGGTVVEALLGGDVEVPLVTQVTGNVELESNSSASTLDLADLATFTGGTLAYSGGTLTHVGGTQPLPDLTNASGSTFQISGAASLSLPALTAATATNFEVSGGASLDLAGLDAYTQPNNCCYTAYLEATGAGSVLSLPDLASIANTGSGGTVVEALLGGDVEVPLVTQVTGNVELESNSSASTLDLADLATFTGGTLAYSGGTLTHVGGTQPLPDLTNASGSTFQISGAASLSLPALTAATATNFEVSGGASLDLAGLDAYTQPNNCCYTAYLEATGAGSVLSLPDLASIANTGSGGTVVEALLGGDVEVPLVTQVTGNVELESNSSASTLDLADLATFTGGTLAYSGGTLTHGGGTQPLPDLTNANGSTFQISGGVSLSLPTLSAATATNFEVSGGASLDLAGLDAYTQPNNCCYTAYLEATAPAASSRCPTSPRSPTPARAARSSRPCSAAMSRSHWSHRSPVTSSWRATAPPARSTWPIWRPSPAARSPTAAGRSPTSAGPSRCPT